MPAPSRTENAACLLAAAAATALLVARAVPYFPDASRLVGGDYSWFFPSMIVGHAWFIQHGWLSPPHVTPAFCGGVPFLANPQSVAYSLPQALLLVMEPVRAVLTTLLASAALGGSMCFLVARRSFGASRPAATLAGLLYGLNGFLFYRLVIGHLPYHAFALAPLLAYPVLGRHRESTGSRSGAPRQAIVPGIIAAGLVVAYVTYAGALNLQIPLVLTVVLALLMREIRHGADRRPWLVLGGGLVWGSLLSAAKLVPASIFVAPFSRHTIPLYLFSDSWMLVQALLTGFLVPAGLGDSIVFGPEAALGRHEFEFGVSVVPLLICTLGLLAGGRGAHTGGRWRPWLMFLALAALPIALCVEVAGWGEFLLRVPVINSNTTFVRWWAVFILPLCLATAVCFDRLARTPLARTSAFAVSTAAALVQTFLQQPAYYADARTRFDPSADVAAYEHLQAGGRLPPIREIGTSRSVRVPGAGVPRLNDAFLEGRSARPCYEPLFGYEGELAPDLALVDGRVDLVTDGRVNLVDPAEYFSTRSVGERTWRFDQRRHGDATAFASYDAPATLTPWWVRACGMVTVATMIASALALAGFTVARPPPRTTPPRA